MIRGTIDIFTIRAGLAQSLQSCLLAPAPPVDLAWLKAYGEGYFCWLEQLPGIVVERGAQGERCVATLGLRLPLLRFAAPYLVAAHGGQELRYAIRGGLMAQRTNAWLGFGYRNETAGLRLWIDVANYRPRLGVGRLYQATQARFHQWITLSFLREFLHSAASAG